MGISGKEDTHDARGHNKHGYAHEQYENQDSLIEKIFKCHIRLFAFCYRKIDIFHIGLVALYAAEPTDIDDYYHQPPDHIDYEKRGDGNSDEIRIRLWRDQEPNIGTHNDHDEKDSPGNENGVYPMFFDNHQKTYVVFFQFFEELCISCDVKRLEHPGDDAWKIYEHIKRQW